MSDTTLEIESFVQGPAATNAYLIGDPHSGTAVVIDPAWDGAEIAAAATMHSWRVVAIWLTHAHFDHFGGAARLFEALETPVQIALHPLDQPLWRIHGGAMVFGFQDFDPGPEPTIALDHGMQLHFAGHTFQVRHTPGHTPGHVAFSCPEQGLLFCGDLIFSRGVGRTDLPGGDMNALLNSIRAEVLTLPDETRLLSGHGPETTVGEERLMNPFLQYAD